MNKKLKIENNHLKEVMRQITDDIVCFNLSNIEEGVIKMEQAGRIAVITGDSKTVEFMCERLAKEIDNATGEHYDVCYGDLH